MEDYGNAEKRLPANKFSSKHFRVSSPQDYYVRLYEYPVADDVFPRIGRQQRLLVLVVMQDNFAFM